MSPTNGQIIAEARRRAKEQNWRMDIEDYIIEVMREGWTPPEVDADILAFREWAAENAPALGAAEAYRKGLSDNTHYARCFLAGARMAREQERERAKVLLEFAEDIAKFSLNYGVRANRALAKYRGEA